LSNTPNPPVDGTGAALVQFLDYAIRYGLMKSATASSYKVAVKELLSATHGDAWESVDVLNMDLDDISQRFQTLRAMKFSPESLGTYRSRFRSAVAMYREYLSAPDRSTWRPTMRQARATSNGLAKVRRDPDTTPATPTEVSVPAPVPATAPGPPPRMITYPFPLRDGIIVSLLLPPDLTKREAKRLNGFIDSLAVEEPPAFDRGRPEVSSVEG
jgi:hypothetical protein